ncbi:hypothetical protein V8E54_009123 [Elaphomyces granulatus]
MDPITAVGFATSTVQLIGALTTVFIYFNDVKNAPKERATLARETTSLLALLTDLRFRLEETKLTDPWFTNIRSLGVENGPLDQFKGALEDLVRKFKPRSGIGRIGWTLRWTLDKNEINDTLLKIERLKTLVSLALQNDHYALLRAVKDDVSVVAKGIAYQKNRHIVDWISTLNFSTKQNDFFGRHQEGTGEWMLQDVTFKKWLDGTERVLWCPGLPGAGKTILTSIIVDYLEQSFEREDIAIAYIYFSYKEQDDQTTTNLLTSLLQQLVQRKTMISDGILSLYDYHAKRGTRPSLGGWSKVLKSEIENYSKVFILIDALDESNENSGVRDGFLAEIRKLQPSIYLLVTSRHITTIEREFENAARVEIRASDEDVRKYLEGRIERESRLKCHVKAHPALREEIVQMIVKKADGMFLLAQLHLDSLAKKQNRRDVRIALKNLPKKLDDTYDDAMQRIWSQDDEDIRLAHNVLCWISCAFRPLAVTEIQHALAVQSEDRDLDDEALPDEHLLVSVCAGLVTTDRRSNVVRMVHYTTDEYFKRIRITQFPEAQINIATTCLTYVSFDAFSLGHCQSDQETETRLQEYPLLTYAAHHWGDHAREDLRVAVKGLALEFLQQYPKLACSNQIVHLPKHRSPEYSQHFPKDVTGLQIAASFGLEEIVQSMLEKGADIVAKDSFGSTALHLAARRGHEAVVRLLIEKGADATAKDNTGDTALHGAAANGQDAVLELLVEKGVDITMTNDYQRTALQRAAATGHTYAVRALLEKGADIDAEDVHGNTALQLAAMGDHVAVIRLLVERGADVLAKDSVGGTALHSAAANRHVASAQLLLEYCRERDPTAGDEYLNLVEELLTGPGGRVFCDNCNIRIIPSDAHYHCRICEDDDFDLCEACVNNGMHCRNDGHRLGRRHLRDGRYVDIPANSPRVYK